MTITDCTRQQAGECADALRELMRLGTGWGAMQATFNDIDARLQFRLRDLLTACEDAERGTPVKTALDSPGNPLTPTGFKQAPGMPPGCYAAEFGEFDLGGSD